MIRDGVPSSSRGQHAPPLDRARAIPAAGPSLAGGPRLAPSRVRHTPARDTLHPPIRRARKSAGRGGEAAKVGVL